MKNFYFTFIFLFLFVSACSPASSGGSGGSGGGQGVREFAGIVAESTRTPQRVFERGVPTTDESGTSAAFRIPGILKLDDGRVAYAGDVRWASTSDSAHNIDSGIRFSDDNGQTWGPMKFIQQFEDFANSNVVGSTGNRSIVSMSASYIDPGIVQAANGDILVITTVFPRGAGLFSPSDGNPRLNPLNPFTNVGGVNFIKLRPQGSSAVTDTAARSDATYTMMAPVGGGAITMRDGSPVTGELAGYSIDANWIVRQPDGSAHQGPQYVRGTTRGNLVRVTPTRNVDTHLFYYNSPFHPVGKNYIFLSRSTDGGNTFSYPRDISSQFITANNTVLRDRGFYGVSPGVGYRLREGNNRGRLLVALQPVFSACFATSIYSDDNGTTWRVGDRVGETLVDDIDGSTKTATRLSETQYVEGPENQLFAFHRTGGLSRIAYSISLDGGVTWAAQRLSPLNSVSGGGVMIGATRLYNTTVFGQQALALSFPQSTARDTGVVHVGFFQRSEQNFPGTTTRMFLPVFPGAEAVNNDANYTTFITPQDANHKYGYSSVTELPNGNIGVAYEYHNDPIPSSGGERTLDFSEIRLNRN